MSSETQPAAQSAKSAAAQLGSVDPSAPSSIERLGEESRGLLVKIVEGLAYREVMLANIRGHGLKFVHELDAKLKLVRELETALVLFREIERIYAALGSRDVISAVRDRMERIPYPSSRLELELCLFLCEKTSRTALAAYRGGKCRELEALCLSRLESIVERAEPEGSAFVEFCADPTNRPHAQQMFTRWLGISMLAMGRPGSKGDTRAVELGLRRTHVETIGRGFLAELEPFRQRCHLAWPDASAIGIEFPTEKRISTR
ncbi:MAG: hypothetical protein L6Q99_06490 [Planctomycetes bacterium]|nr:hypothetical protein [Planctomycetota bacterium]